MLVPARMLNEFVYCPRLFHIEWVQGRFTDNDDTVEGRWHHRVVNQEAGRVPAPDEVALKIRARAVSLSSDRLGLIAKVDLLEGDAASVVPVDYKRGTPPDVEHRVRDPERVQVCAQVLLARDNGYRCDEGAVYFAGSRERVPVVIDDALVELTTNSLRDLRVVAARSEPPPPLVDSPKCPRCSLVTVCLPDETNTLTERSRRPPRRLVPTASEARPLYVTEQGAVVGVRDGRVDVRVDRTTRSSERLIDVSQVNLYGNVQVSTQAFRTFFSREIPVCFFTYGGWFSGLAEGLPSKFVELRRRQTLAGPSVCTAIAGAMVTGKIRNSRTLLMRNSRDRPESTIAALKRLAERAAEAPSIPSLLGIEGTAARLYFDALPTMLRAEQRIPGAPFAFEGRNRRPPRDGFNCLLSFVYGLLVKDCTTTLLGVGFDPYQGVYHQPRFGRPALALDLAEEFRPLLADSVVVNLVNNGEIRPSHFLVRGQGVGLTSDGRKAVIAAYERRLAAEVRHPVFDYRVTYRRVLETQARLLGAHLLGEVPAYIAMVTR